MNDPLKHPRTVPCPTCDGTGRHWYGAPTGLETCGLCNGSGQVLPKAKPPTIKEHARVPPVDRLDVFDFHHMDLNEAIEKAEQIGDKGLCVIKTGVLDNGRPIMFVIAVGDGVDALHKTMSQGGHRILPDESNAPDADQNQPPTDTKHAP